MFSYNHLQRMLSSVNKEINRRLPLFLLSYFVLSSSSFDVIRVMTQQPLTNKARLAIHMVLVLKLLSFYLVLRYCLINNFVVSIVQEQDRRSRLSFGIFSSSLSEQQIRSVARSAYIITSMLDFYVQGFYTVISALIFQNKSSWQFHIANMIAVYATQQLLFSDVHLRTESLSIDYYAIHMRNPMRFFSAPLFADSDIDRNDLLQFDPSQ